MHGLVSARSQAPARERLLALKRCLNALLKYHMVVGGNRAMTEMEGSRSFQDQVPKPGEPVK